MPRTPRKPRPAPSRADLADKLPLTGTPWGGLIFSSAGFVLLLGLLWLVFCVSTARPVWPW